jgi:hypothetical protein
MDWTCEETWLDCRQAKDIFKSSNASRSNMVPPSLQWVSRAFSLEASGLGRGTNHFPFLGRGLSKDVPTGC